jgi:hypothetical protein
MSNLSDDNDLLRKVTISVFIINLGILIGSCFTNFLATYRLLLISTLCIANVYLILNKKENKP